MLPTLPKGATLDKPQEGLPALPPGAVPDAPPLPNGATLDTPSLPPGAVLDSAPAPQAATVGGDEEQSANQAFARQVAHIPGIDVAGLSNVFPTADPRVMRGEEMRRTLAEDDARRAAAGLPPALAQGSAGFTDEYRRIQSEMPGAVKRGVLQGVSNLGTVIESITGDTDPARQARREAQIDQIAPGSATPEVQFAEQFIKETTEAAPLLAAASPLQIPGRVGKLVTAGLKRAGAPAGAASAAGGVGAAATGIAEFGAAAQVPESVQEGSAAPALQGAAHPFISVGSMGQKVATGNWRDITVDEWVNAAFLAVGGARGLSQFQGQLSRARSQARAVADELVAKAPDKAAEVRAMAAARGDKVGQEVAAAIDDAMAAAKQAPKPSSAPVPTAPPQIAAEAPQPRPKPAGDVTPSSPSGPTPPEGQPNVPRETSVPAQPRDVLAEQPPAPVTESPIATVKPPATDVSPAPVAPRSVQETQPDAQAQPAQPPVETPEPTAAQVETPRAEQPQAAKPVAQDAETGQGGPPTKIQRAKDEPSPKGAFSARRVDVDRDRAEMGKTAIASPDARHWDDVLEQAATKIDADAADRLARDIISNPKPMTDVETAGLVIRRVEIGNQYDDIVNEIITKQKSGESTAFLEGELRALEDQFDLVTKAMRMSGTEKGRALAAQRLTINKNFDLVSVVNRYEAKKGGKASPAEKQQLKAMTDRLQAVEAELATVQSRMSELEATKALNRSARTSRSKSTPPRKTLIDNIRDLVKKGCAK